MILRTINDPASLERQRKLLAWLESDAERLATVAQGEIQQGRNANALAISFQVQINRRIAEAVRERLVDVAEQALCDLDDEPPCTLRDLTDWLVAKLGRFFPLAPVEVWQGIGFILAQFRRAS